MKFQGWIFICIIILILSFSGCEGKRISNADDNSLTDTVSEEREESALEIFCRYYGKLIEEGREGELEQYVISKLLSQEEAVALGEYKALSYFEGFGELQYNAKRVIVLETDIDGDGENDIIEYDLNNCTDDSPQSSSLTIYQKAENNFTMVYSQPKFDTTMFWRSVSVCVVKYEGEVFVLFRECDDITINKIDIYWLKDFEFVGRCIIHSRSYNEVVVEQVSCKEEYRNLANKILKEVSCIVNAERNSIVAIEYPCIVLKNETIHGGCFWGSAEKCVSKSILEGTAEADLCSFIKNWSGDEIEETTIWETVQWCNGQIFQGDINNDGEIETYIKTENALGLTYYDFWTRSMLIQITEDYGDHTGKANGLRYYMESCGKAVDFENMCGLDIWSFRLTPRMFWVDEVNGRNIIFYICQGTNKWEYEIIGYDIEVDKYIEVLRIGGHVNVECEYLYEWKKGRNSSFPYGVRMAYGDIEQVVLYGMVDEKKQEIINTQIQELIIREIEERGKEYYLSREETARYTLYQATKDEMTIKYKYIWFDEEKEQFDSSVLWLHVDIANNTCIETDSLTRSEFLENVW